MIPPAGFCRNAALQTPVASGEVARRLLHPVAAEIESSQEVPVVLLPGRGVRALEVPERALLVPLEKGSF